MHYVFKNTNSLEVLGGDFCLMELKYVNHPLLKPDKLIKRKYQVDIFVKCTQSNCLVVVPTGMGKTIIALLLSIHQLHQHKGKIIFLAPTRPLIEQHMKTFLNLTTISEEELLLFTGSTSPNNRQNLYDDSERKCYFMTPQILQNDLIANRIHLSNITLLIFDEAHRATGNYAYTFLAKKYIEQARIPKILAMTASPGKNREIIEDVMKNLYIDAIEIRTEFDPDVKPYIQEVETIWKDVKLPEEMVQIKEILEDLQSQIYKELKNQELLASADLRKVSRKTLLSSTQKLDALISKNRQSSELGRLLFSKKLLANAIRLSHMSELIEAQGINALKEYLDKNVENVEEGKGGKSLRELFRSTPIQDLILVVNHLVKGQINHPKIGTLLETLDKQFQINSDSRVLVFCHFRDTVRYLESILNQSDKIRAHLFIGQQKKGKTKGLTQKEQLNILDRFKTGDINTLIATSVAEEGLDISECDVVIFYDVVPSEIRAIQRRGRTGRNSKGKVIIFKTLGTREEGYFWAEKRREKEMKKILKEIQNEMNNHGNDSKKHQIKGQKSITNYFSSSKKKQKTSKSDNLPIRKEIMENDLQKSQNIKKRGFDFSPNDKKQQINSKNIKKDFQFTPYIIIDTRETASAVTRELSEHNAIISLQKLSIGDYIVSDRCGVERKAVEDFISSLKDGRLFAELDRLRKQFKLPVLIIEGDLNTAISFNRSAILGALSSIMLNMQVYIFQTRNTAETADIIYAFAKKEQEKKEKSNFTIRFKKFPKDKQKKLEYVIAGLPGINASRAQDLLSHFHTLQNIFNASIKELQQAPNIGPVIAKSIHEVATLDYFLEKKKNNSKLKENFQEKKSNHD